MTAVPYDYCTDERAKDVALKFEPFLQPGMIWF